MVGQILEDTLLRPVVFRDVRFGNRVVTSYRTSSPLGVGTNRGDFVPRYQGGRSPGSPNSPPPSGTDLNSKIL